MVRFRYVKDGLGQTRHNSENQQLAMACDPVKKDEEYTINGKTFSVESTKEFNDAEAGFVRRDCLLKQI